MFLREVNRADYNFGESENVSVSYLLTKRDKGL